MHFQKQVAYISLRTACYIKALIYMIVRMIGFPYKGAIVENQAICYNIKSCQITPNGGLHNDPFG